MMSVFSRVLLVFVSLLTLPYLITCDWTTYVENVPWINFNKPTEWGNQKILAMTFDDGPSANTTNTNLILDILEKYQVPATFFQTFNYLNPQSDSFVAVVKRIYSNPLFTIGDHTLSHIDLATQSPVDRQNALEQVRQTEQQIGKTVGAPPMTLMRAPYGSPYLDYWNGGSATMTQISQQVFDMGFISIGWQLDTSDYTCQVLHPENPVKCVTDNAFPLLDGGGIGIVLMHDIYDHTRIALPQVLDHAKSLGYTFVSVEDMIKKKYGKSSADIVGSRASTYTSATGTSAAPPSGSPSSGFNDGPGSTSTPSPTPTPSPSHTSTPSPAPAPTSSTPAPTPSSTPIVGQNKQTSFASSTAHASFSFIGLSLIALFSLALL